jgi:hypothetical protein
VGERLGSLFRASRGVAPSYSDFPSTVLAQNWIVYLSLRVDFELGKITHVVVMVIAMRHRIMCGREYSKGTNYEEKKGNSRNLRRAQASGVAYWHSRGYGVTSEIINNIVPKTALF